MPAFILTHQVYQGRDQIIAILQAIFQIHLSCATYCVVYKLRWNLFPGRSLQNPRIGSNTGLLPNRWQSELSHYLKQFWPDLLTHLCVTRPQRFQINMSIDYWWRLNPVWQICDKLFPSRILRGIRNLITGLPTYLGLEGSYTFSFPWTVEVQSLGNVYHLVGHRITHLPSKYLLQSDFSPFVFHHFFYWNLTSSHGTLVPNECAWPPVSGEPA